LNDEARILEEVRNVVNDKRQSTSPIAAIVIEPTQQSTGYSVSNDFIKTLKAIAHDNESALVVDETSTGCFASGAGHFWQYQGEADYVSFGKRT
jgi:4-aminobutyrate aminotransferase-like enzyme